MEALKVAFIGHREIKNADEVTIKLKNIISALIEEENAKIFLFGSKSCFDDLCLAVVTQLKEKYYPFIERIYVRSTYEYINESYEKYLLRSYDKTFYPSAVKGAGYRSYVKRNQIMIDTCDVLVTYYDKDYRPLYGKSSGTKTAVGYALKIKKRIINAFDKK